MARSPTALLASCVAVLPLLVTAYVQECWSMGETCGNEARCTGMGTHCGDNSECSGSSSTCGANSICSGIDSRCGPSSQCTGLGAQCESIGIPAQAQSQSQSQSQSQPTSFKPMHFEPMHWEPMKSVRPSTVYLHGCDQGDTCANRPGAAQSDGVTVCCKEGCAKCEASTSQSGSVLTATCVCEEQVEAQAQAQTQRTASGLIVDAKGCKTGPQCNGRPGAAQSDGLAFCCDEHCGQCAVGGQASGGVLTAECMCAGRFGLEEEPAAAEPAAAATVAASFTAFAGLALLLAVAGKKVIDSRRSSDEGWSPLPA